jgi:hypothetical protein
MGATIPLADVWCRRLALPAVSSTTSIIEGIASTFLVHAEWLVPGVKRECGRWWVTTPGRDSPADHSNAPIARFRN